MRARFRLSVRFFVLTVIASLSFGAIITKQSVNSLNASAAVQSVTSVNAASFQAPIAPSTISAVFGANLATQSVAATTVPLPTTLGGVSVQIIDGNNASFAAPLFFVSPNQINLHIPDQVAPGNGQIIVNNGAGVTTQGQLFIANSSPGIFTTNFSGSGLAAALQTFDGVTFNPVANADGSARPVSTGTPQLQSFLILFGTGLRRITDLRVQIGAKEVTPVFVGATSFAGLDQVNVPMPSDTTSGTVNILVKGNGRVSNQFQVLVQPTGITDPQRLALTVADIQTIIAQGVAKAQQLGLAVTISVLDKEANLLGSFKMNGARSDVTLGATDIPTGRNVRNLIADPDGLERLVVPVAQGLPFPLNDGALLASISKAGTAAFLSQQGSAISTRSASYIVQEHFPPTVSSNPGGPLFGVQFSSLPCSDIKQPNLPFGLSGDPGGLPIYKNGVHVGGVGVEGNGIYSVDLNLSDYDNDTEENIALAATLGFEPPQSIQINTLPIGGHGVDYCNARQSGGAAPPFASLPGTVIIPIQAQPPSRFIPLTMGQVPGRVDPRFFPFRNSAVSSLTSDDVATVIIQAAQQAYRMRAGIRQPVPSATEVNITVVDTDGNVLGIFSTIDAPVFGFDVSAQKARTAVLFSRPDAATLLRGAGFGKFVDAAATFGVRLDGSIMFSNRGMGFLARPFFPDGIDFQPNGPFSKPFNVWSPFNDGLQIALVRPALASILSTGQLPAGGSGTCSPFPNLPALVGGGIQIFAGSVPLFKNGTLVGAIGISGDGIEQDDNVAISGSVGFESPLNVRCDTLTPFGVRLPFIKYPSHPNFRNYP